MSKKPKITQDNNSIEIDLGSRFISINTDLNTLEIYIEEEAYPDFEYDMEEMMETIL